MRSILLSASTSWAARILAVALNIVGLPLALHALGRERFGLLLVVLSIGSWIGFANIGVGRSVANIVSRYARRAPKMTRQLVSAAANLSALFNSSLLVVAVLLFFLVLLFLPMNEVVVANYWDFSAAILLTFAAMCLSFYLSVFEGVDAGKHQLHRLYLFQLAGYSISIVLLFSLFPAFPSIVLAAYLLNLGFILGSLLHALDVYRRNRLLFSNQHTLKRKTARILLFQSLDFSAISIGIAIMFQLPTGLFGLMYGPDQVVNLGILMRLMQSYGALIIAFTFALTTLISSRIEGREWPSTLHIVRWSGALLLVGSVTGGVLFYLLANTVLKIWLGPVEFESLFIFAATVLIVVTPAQFYLAAILIGGTNPRIIAAVHLIQACVCLVFCFPLFFLAKETGIIIALDAVLLIGCVYMFRTIYTHPALKEIFVPCPILPQQSGGIATS